MFADFAGLGVNVLVGAALEASTGRSFRSMGQHMDRLGRGVDRHQRNLPRYKRAHETLGRQLRLTGDATGRLTARHEKLGRLIDRTRKRGRDGGTGETGFGGGSEQPLERLADQNHGPEEQNQGREGGAMIASAKTRTLASDGASHAQTNAAAKFAHRNTVTPSMSGPMPRSRRPMLHHRLRAPSRPFLCRRRYADMCAAARGSRAFDTKAA